MQESDIDITEAPPLPEWLARDPDIRPGAVRPRAIAAPTLAQPPRVAEDPTHDGPTLPTLDQGRPVPSSVTAAPVVPGQRIVIVRETDPNDWLLVAVGVGLSAIVLASMIVLLGV